MRYYGSRISENIAKTPEGFIICQNVPLARTGTQEYEPGEIGLEGGGMVMVQRLEEEVFSKTTMASFEGRPVTNDHPEELLQKDNVGYYQKGHVQNVRRGQGEQKDYLLGDLFVTHPDLIDAILGGKREVSCGYDCVYDRENSKVFQRAIRGNHVAVVDRGRAGSRVAIKDHQPQRDLVSEAFEPGEEGPKEQMNIEAGETLQGKQKEERNSMVPEKDRNREPERKVTYDDELTQLLQEILALLQQLTQEGAGEATEDEDPMAQMEEELDGAMPQRGCAELIEPEEDMEEPYSKDEDKGLSALAALKPAIAKLPKNQRKMMADAVSNQARRLKGYKHQGKNQVADFARAMKRQSFDARGTNEGEIGKKIMEKRNPHYQK